METSAGNTLTLTPIGLIHTPFTAIDNMPVQPAGAKDTPGQIVLNRELAPGLRDIEGFSHIFLIYQFHRASRTELVVTPFLDTAEHGVFATRSPLRPNHLGLSVVRLVGVEGHILQVLGVDMLDQTPLIDIKPFIAAFDQVDDSTCGWMTGDRETVAAARSDQRFR